MKSAGKDSRTKWLTWRSRNYSQQKVLVLTRNPGKGITFNFRLERVELCKCYAMCILMERFGNIGQAM